MAGVENTAGGGDVVAGERAKADIIGDGLFRLLEPVVDQCDASVRDVRASQAALAAQIDALQQVFFFFFGVVTFFCGFRVYGAVFRLDLVSQ